MYIVSFYFILFFNDIVLIFPAVDSGLTSNEVIQ